MRVVPSVCELVMEVVVCAAGGGIVVTLLVWVLLDRHTPPHLQVLNTVLNTDPLPYRATNNRLYNAVIPIVSRVIGPKLCWIGIGRKMGYLVKVIDWPCAVSSFLYSYGQSKWV